MSAITSPPPTQNYTYTRPSTTATRALIDSAPSSQHASGTATPSDPTSPHGTLHRRKTNNYESALADRLSASIPAAAEDSPAAASSSAQPVIASGMAYRGAAAAAAVQQQQPTSPASDEGSTDRPLLGVLGRQQSFKQNDQKRAQMERILGADEAKRGGYSSTQRAEAV